MTFPIQLASDIDKISKMEPDQLSNGEVNQLAAEISKVSEGGTIGRVAVRISHLPFNRKVVSSSLVCFPVTW